MKGTYYLSVGRRIKIEQSGNVLMFQILIRDKWQLLTTETFEDSILFSIWEVSKLPWELNRLLFWAKGLIRESVTDEMLLKGIEELKEQRLLVVVDLENPEQSFEQLKVFSLIAQGEGDGTHKGKAKIEVARKTFKVSELEFRIWELSHRYQTIESVYSFVQNEGTDYGEFLNALLDLFRKGLIYLE